MGHIINRCWWVQGRNETVRRVLKAVILDRDPGDITTTGAKCISPAYEVLNGRPVGKAENN